MISLEDAQAHLNAWLQADIALANAQSYMVTTPSGTRQVTRAQRDDIAKQISYWSGIVMTLKGEEKPLFSRSRFVVD